MGEWTHVDSGLPAYDEKVLCFYQDRTLDIDYRSQLYGNKNCNDFFWESDDNAVVLWTRIPELPFGW